MTRKYQVAILGCGAIFDRHIAAIDANHEHFTLVGVYDVNRDLCKKQATNKGVYAYHDLEEVYQDARVNCIIILTPSHLHYQQALQAIAHGKNVIVEKPATFLSAELLHLVSEATKARVEIFTILQVRLNRSVVAVKRFLDSGAFGRWRGISLIQRWQRPSGYLQGWRGELATGGGILREFAIHYLDIMQYLVAGDIQVNAANYFYNKFTQGDVVDTIYALCTINKQAHNELGAYSCGGSIEITIASEPANLECSLALMSDSGFIALGGKSLDVITQAEFLHESLSEQFTHTVKQVNAEQVAHLVASGASPFHPELYRQLVVNPHAFTLRQSLNVIELIEDIYKQTTSS